jgi:transcriptional regulator with XRE-family HTH domain
MGTPIPRNILFNPREARMRDANMIGRKIAKLRFQHQWTQDTFVAKLQIRFADLKITRDILANIETKRCVSTDKHLHAFALVLGVEVGELFRP